MIISVLEAATLGKDLDLTPFAEFGELKTFDNISPEDEKEIISESDIIVINKIKIGEHNLKDVKRLKLICEMATGYDNIDLESCKKRGIAVCNVVGYSANSVAQITLCMVLSLFSHIEEYRKSVYDGKYNREGIPNILTPVYHEIFGKTWGIIGYGNIGKQVANVAKALGCNILINKRTPVPDINCTDLDTLCRNSDIISVHTPLTPQTKGFISRERIAMMKKDAIFINVARGAVADEAALAEAVLEDRLGGIGIDVYAKEPFGADHPFAKISGRPNVYLTPHMAWGAYEARARCRDEAIENIRAFLSGERRNRVDC